MFSWPWMQLKYLPGFTPFEPGKCNWGLGKEPGNDRARPENLGSPKCSRSVLFETIDFPWFRQRDFPVILKAQGCRGALLHCWGLKTQSNIWVLARSNMERVGNHQVINEEPSDGSQDGRQMKGIPETCYHTTFNCKWNINSLGR